VIHAALEIGGDALRHQLAIGNARVTPGDDDDPLRGGDRGDQEKEAAGSGD